jgi:hypothetical protein
LKLNKLMIYENYVLMTVFILVILFQQFLILFHWRNICFNIKPILIKFPVNELFLCSKLLKICNLG